MLDLSIQNGTLADGTGAPLRKTHLGIKHGRVVSQGESAAAPATEIIDAAGLVVAPGFVDIHAHADLDLLRSGGGLLKLRQGVTTEVVGNCGLSPTPVSAGERAGFKVLLSAVLGELDREWTWTDLPSYLDELERTALSHNIAVLAAHGSLRREVMGLEPSPPSESQWRRLEEELREALEVGAWGLSTGLSYPPAVFSTDLELERLARVTALGGGYLAVHMRSEGGEVQESLESMLSISRNSGVPLQISHFKAYGKSNWHKAPRLLSTVEEARRQGVDVAFDSYPYIMGSTYLSSVLPAWLSQGGEAVARLADPCLREKVLHQLRTGIPGKESYLEVCGWEGLVYLGGNRGAFAELEGRNLVEIAAVLRTDPPEAVLRLLEGEGGTAAMLIYAMDEATVRQIMAHPVQMTGSDGLYNHRPHPRVAGTYPRILGRYVRDERLFSLESAIHKLSGAPARRVGLKDRGIIAPGAWADLVIFDPDTVAEGATTADPTAAPRGIRQVLVNGISAIKDGIPSPTGAGRLLRRGRD